MYRQERAGNFNHGEECVSHQMHFIKAFFSTGGGVFMRLFMLPVQF